MFFKIQKPEVVTRFLCSYREVDKKAGKAKFTAFYKPKNMNDGEISVFNIDKELKYNQEENIYQIGDREVFKRPKKTIARADLKVLDIEKLRVNSTTMLKVHSKLGKKHCNIKPFPKEELLAQNISTQLARISNLHIRKITT